MSAAGGVTGDGPVLWGAGGKTGKLAESLGLGHDIKPLLSRLRTDSDLSHMFANSSRYSKFTPKCPGRKSKWFP